MSCRSTLSARRLLACVLALIAVLGVGGVAVGSSPAAAAVQGRKEPCHVTAGLGLTVQITSPESGTTVDLGRVSHLGRPLAGKLAVWGLGEF